MQLTTFITRATNRKALKEIIVVALAATWLAGCDNSAASSAGKGGSGGTMRELVQVERPDPPGAMHRIIRETSYEACAGAAQALNLPVKPFPQVPADYVSERTTVITDGSNYVRKIEHPYNEVADQMSPETGCEYRIEPSKEVDIYIVNDGKSTSVRRASDGQWRVEKNTIMPAAKKAGSEDASTYSEQLTINGVKLRCLSASNPLISRDDLQALCRDASDQPLSTGGKPVVLYSRVKPPIGGTDFSYVVVTEPVSLKQLNQHDGKIFDPATYTK
ncbi:hypothetical protein [Collimonas humicola]|uniref:hypothetical protein n=1 Tax=Collimonas humicola TaxID=2825886 RepID=UPI001B8C13E5|nr:hypothetical protein [Collimonas humicola]